MMTRAGLKLGLAALSVWATVGGWSALARAEAGSRALAETLAPPPPALAQASPAAPRTVTPASPLATRPPLTASPPAPRNEVQAAVPTRAPRPVARTRSSR
jgi:hypothetical protein